MCISLNMRIKATKEYVEIKPGKSSNPSIKASILSGFRGNAMEECCPEDRVQRGGVSGQRFCGDECVEGFGGVQAGKIEEPFFGLAGEGSLNPVGVAIGEAPRMERLPGQEQFPALLFGEAALDQVQVIALIQAVEFIAHDGAAGPGQMDSYLMLASGEGEYLQEAESLIASIEGTEERIAGFRRGAVAPDTIFDGDRALQVLAQGLVDGAICGIGYPVDDGQIAFSEFALLQEKPQRPGGCAVFGGQDNPAGFTVQTVDEVNLGGGALFFQGVIAKSVGSPGALPWILPQRAGALIDTEPGHEAAQAVGFGGMANQSGRFIDQQELRILIDDIEEMILFGCFHRAGSLSGCGVFVSRKNRGCSYFSRGDSSAGVLSSTAKVFRKDSTRL